ncbi:serine protease [Patescibacteria group bacterium]|nr:serine protease [Patescibacteria group bacterium]MBU1028647.1 serine protease [Patescibacteria group bacterium]MBU1915932.1 serine protease [Patescibacteria group bacterium]
MNKTVGTVISVLATLAIALGACSGCHQTSGGSTTPEGEHECPPCPPYLGQDPEIDPLAGSTLDDGFTDAERTQFIRDNVQSTVRIVIANHNKNIGLGFGGGTGVAITPGLVLTAAHVVDEFRFMYGVRRLLARDNLTILHPRALDMRVAAQTNELRDVALLETRDGEQFDRPIPMSLGRAINDGDLLWQFGRTTRWSRGRVLNAANPRSIKIEFTVAGGDSGGPVVRPDGTLAGIILSRSLDPEDRVDDNTSNVAFFITLDEALRGLSQSRLR